MSGDDLLVWPAAAAHKAAECARQPCRAQDTFDTSYGSPALFSSRMCRSACQDVPGRARACRYVGLMKELVEISVPLAGEVERLTAAILDLRLRDSSGPAVDVGVQGDKDLQSDPFWQHVAVVNLGEEAAGIHEIAAIVAEREGYDGAEGDVHVAKADIVAAICVHVVDQGVAAKTLELPHVRPGCLVAPSCGWRAMAARVCLGGRNMLVRGRPNIILNNCRCPSNLRNTLVLLGVMSVSNPLQSVHVNQQLSKSQLALPLVQLWRSLPPYACTPTQQPDGVP